MIYGIDIGGTKIEFVAFDDALEAVERRRLATPAHDYGAFTQALTQLIEEADARFGGKAPVGLGMPGLTDREGRALCANLPGVTGHKVAQDMAQRLGRPVAMLNDTRCFALSEARGGAGEGHRVVFGAILGTGAAGGLVIDGHVEDGHRGLAGEYGHLPLPAALQQTYDLPILTCGCGLPGCFEAYVAGEGLIALARCFGADVADSRALAAAWRAGDRAALATRDAFLDILGASFANIVKLCDPDIIVLGGGLSLIEEVCAGLPAAIAGHLFSGLASPPVVRAKFGDSSGVRGAAILASLLEP
ncbi:ROK family protein [Novosphingobium terrae]|uniref:ROK family protein n=1 Tax=Novosphingobium terrae TaxID=2726189 RepID=UPI001981966C|nr:ROK family protein [Novosphingobium terrae]